MGILCVFNGLVYVASMIISIIGTVMHNTVEENAAGIIEELLEKGYGETESNCGLVNLETRMKNMRNWGIVIMTVCGINFVITLLFWLNILSF